MTLPQVTIGIPCYNNRDWLGEAITSALGQQWVACEVIVADDGSTDGSLEVAQGFSPQVRVITAEHQGANHARNAVLREANGGWVQFLDADDFLLPDKVARQLAQAGDADVLYSPVWMQEENAEQRRSELTINTSADLFTQWFRWELPQTGGCLWRTEALRAIGGWKEDQPCCQEHELYLRALQAGLHFRYAAEAGAVYRIWSEDTLCRRDPARTIQERTRLFTRMRAWLEEQHRWTSEHLAAAGQACFEMARTLAKEDRRAAGEYHRERRSAGMLHLAGPAAPLAYRAMYRMLGFTRAEHLATLLRTRSRA